jgi:HAE1 family hydrophobic/amphiphilic exporter-1
VESLARLAVRRPIAIVVLAAAVVLMGLAAWDDLPVDLLPDVQSPTVLVSLESGQRPPAEMERLYGERIEQRLFTVRGIREIFQVARTGRLVARVVFEWDADMDLALIDVQKAVASLAADPDVDELVVRRFDPRQAPVVSLGLLPRGQQVDLVELRRVARRQIAPTLERIEGVAEARVIGGRELEVQVRVDPLRLEAHTLTLDELATRLRAANLDIDAGTLEERGEVYLVRGIARFREPADIADVVIRYAADRSDRLVPVRVSDVAEVTFAPREVTHLVRVDGREGVGLSVYKEAGANTVAVSRRLHDALGALERDLPDLAVQVVADEAAIVQEAIGEVEGAALVGILLAIGVLVLFLRSAGPTLIVGAAVPVSLLGALFLMMLGDQTLNIMTLGGLALGAGMLVDNAIVVVESIFRRLSAGDDVAEACSRGVGAVGGAIVSSTLTTCAVFLPVLFVRGLAARLVSGLAFAVVASLLVSLLVALLLIPALARWLLPRRRARALDPGRGRLERFVGRLLRRPGLLVAGALLLVAGSFVVLRGLGTELLPPADPRQFSVRLVGPPGQPVEATERAVAVVEEILREAAGGRVAAVQSEVGRIPEDDRFIREEQTDENTARILVRLADDAPGARAVVAAAAPAVAELGRLEVAWEVGASALARALGTTGPPILVEIRGQTLAELREAAARVQEALDARPALWNVRSSFEGGAPEVRVTLDRAVAAALGVDIDDAAAVLAAALDGRSATTMTVGDEEYDVVLRLPEARSDELAGLVLRTASGARVALGSIADFEPDVGAREIFRRDQRRVAQVGARIAPGADYPEARRAAEQALAALELPGGLRAVLAGEEEERARTLGELGWAIGLAVLLVFMVLAGTFESFVHPLTVLSSIPLALVGVGVALGAVGQPIGVTALLGLLILAGLAVNDAILLVASAHDLRAEGIERDEALARASGVRLRPIMMTTLTTTLALVPLAVAGGEAAEIRAPLALTVIGGLLAATLGSLLFVPAVYVVLDRFAGAAGAMAGRVAGRGRRPLTRRQA